MVTSSLAAGGAERAVVLLSAGLQRHHEVTVITIHGSAVDAFSLADGVQRRTLAVAGDSRSLAQGFWNNLKRLSVLRKAVRATRPTIVISHLTETNVLSKLALINTGYPVILIEHSDPAGNARGRVWRYLRRVVYPRAATLVSVSRGINDYFTWLPESKKVVIPNPVMPPEDETAADNSAPATKEKWIVAMGRLIPVKGFDRLLEAFAGLAQKYPEWQLVVLGEGELRSRLEYQIESLGLSGQVQLQGFVSNPFVVLRRAELFVMSSRSEGFPYALLEAMSCGLPAVAMDCTAGLREIIRDGIDGRLVPDGDIAALAAALDQLMRDDAERRRLAERAPEVVARFGTDQVVARWETLFQELVNESSRAGS